jgi:hypothetical protein
MTEISIPDNEMNEFDLPRIDIITGSTDGVVFKPVKFQWYPQWVAVFALAPLIFIILALVLMRRTKGELPFTEASYAAWRRGRIALTVSIFGAIVLLIGGVFLLDHSGVLAGLLMLSALVLPIVVGLTMVRGKGPRVVRIAKGFTVLHLPSTAATEVFQGHLTAGGATQP